MLRAWLEAESPTPLRVRITRVQDLNAPSAETVVLTASSLEQTCDVVRDWLDSVVGS